MAAKRIIAVLGATGAQGGSVVRDIQERLNSLPAREGYRVELLGEFKARADSTRHMWLTSMLSLIVAR